VKLIFIISHVMDFETNWPVDKMNYFSLEQRKSWKSVKYFVQAVLE